MNTQQVGSIEDTRTLVEKDVDSVRRVLDEIKIDRNNEAVKALAGNPSSEVFEEGFSMYLNELLTPYADHEEARLLIGGIVINAESRDMNEFKSAYSATAQSSGFIPPVKTISMTASGRNLELSFYLKPDRINANGPEVQGSIGVAYKVT